MCNCFVPSQIFPLSWDASRITLLALLLLDFTTRCCTGCSRWSRTWVWFAWMLGVPVTGGPQQDGGIFQIQAKQTHFSDHLPHPVFICLHEKVQGMTFILQLIASLDTSNVTAWWVFLHRKHYFVANYGKS